MTDKLHDCAVYDVANSCYQGAVAVVGDSIVAVGTTAELLAAGFAEADETIDCSGMVVMPGLIVS